MATDFSVIDNLSITPLQPKEEKEKTNFSSIDELSITSEEDKKLLKEDEKDLSILQKLKKKYDSNDPWIKAHTLTLPGAVTKEVVDTLSTIEASWNEGKLKEVRDLFTKVKEEGVTETTQVEELPPQLKKEEKLNELDAISTTVKYNITDADRVAYGFAKANFFLGHVWDMAQAKVKDVFDDEKTFKDFIVAETERENEEFKKKYWKFADGKKD